MNPFKGLLLAVSLASLAFAGTAAAQARGPLHGSDARADRGRVLESAKGRSSAPKAQKEKSSRDKGRTYSGKSTGRSAPVRGR